MTQQLPWDEAVGRLRERVSPQNYDMWLRPIELMSWDGATLRLRAPNSYIRMWFESNFLPSIVKELQHLGHQEVRVEFDPDSEIRPAPEPAAMPIGTGPMAAMPEPPAPLVPAPSNAPLMTNGMTDDEPGIVAPDQATLNPRYTFETFVAGP